MNCKRIQKFKETCNVRHIYKNEWYEACFAHDAAYGDGKDLAKRTFSDKILNDTAYKIAINLKYAGYQRGLACMVYMFFDKETGLRAIARSKPGAIVNDVLAQELHKPVNKKFSW